MDAQYNSFLEESLEKIQGFHSNEQLALFVGAGASKESGLPDWSQLMEDVRNQLSVTDEQNYLKLAQYYFLQFGESSYYKFLIDKFDLLSKQPNRLTKSIVNLSCKYLVTTNWDDLLEKEIIESGRFYDVVKTDNDFSNLTVNSKLLIKAHGDLNDRNIVFKEEDYLNFSDERPLVENYIKSLFIREVVLFVGYSLSDINIQQTIKWVKNRAQQGLPVYLIEHYKNFNRAEFEYYKSKGIYVLYTKNSKYKSVADFIDQISTFRQLKITDDFNENLKVAAKALKEFENKNYVSGKELVVAFKESFGLYGINEIFLQGWGKPYIFLQNKALLEFFKSVTKKCVDKEEYKNNSDYNLIKNVFSKSIANGIASFNSHELVFSASSENLEINDELLKFDDLAIRQLLRNLGAAASLEKAFYYYKLGDYYESYNQLDLAAREYLKARDYKNYLLAVFNKKKVVGLLRYADQYREKAEIDGIEIIISKERSESLTDAYNQLPKSIQTIMQSFSDLDRFEEEINAFTTRVLKDVSKNGKNRYDYTYLEIYYYTLDLIYKIHLNYLQVEQYISGSYRNIFEAVVFEHEYNKVRHVEFVFYYTAILGYASWKDIAGFLHDKKDLTVNSAENSECLKLLSTSFNSLEKQYLQEDTVKSKYFVNYSNIFALLVFTDGGSLLKPESVFNLINKQSMMFRDYELVDLFVGKYSEKLSPEDLQQLLEIFIDRFICNRFNFYDIEIVSDFDAFDHIFSGLNKCGLNDSFQSKILPYIDRIKGFHIDSRLKVYTSFLIRFLELDGLEEDIKEKISIELKGFVGELEQVSVSPLSENNNTDKTAAEFLNKIKQTDCKFKVFEYKLVLANYKLIEFDVEGEQSLLKLVEDYDGWSSHHVAVYHLVNRLMKANKSEVLVRINEKLLEMDQKWNSR
ncbi:MAG: SIR2 family protein [Thiopseudomonas sp.]|nr:SIR2 family protein [Thiopseudomonas sp.]